jgi:hypothetical protein
MRWLAVFALALLTTNAFPQAAPAPERPWETWQPPIVTLPNPNGFDMYLKAFDLKAELDRANGAAAPQGAGPGGPPGAAPGGPAPPPDDPWGEGPPDISVAERVRLYDEILTLIRRALTQDCRLPPPISLDQPFPYLAAFRQVARLFAMEAHAHCEVGEFGAGAQSALDCIEMAQDVASQRWVLSWLVGAACEAIGMKALDEAIPGLTPAECKAALARLQRLDRGRLPFAAILDGEEAFARLCFKEAMADPEQLRALTGSAGGDKLSDGALQLLHDVQMPISWQRLGPYYDRLRANAERPYAQTEKDLEPPQDDALLLVVAPFAKTILWRDRSIRTTAALRIAQLAARAYALEKGHVPETLAELVPEYLDKAPDDPFGAGPLSARLADGKLLVYSLGPDGLDDGAKAIEGTPDVAAKGDMVVGVTAEK